MTSDELIRENRRLLQELQVMGEHLVLVTEAFNDLAIRMRSLAEARTTLDKNKIDILDS